MKLNLPDSLAIPLDCSISLALVAARDIPSEQRLAMARRAGQILANTGDTLLFGGRRSSERQPPRDILDDAWWRVAPGAEPSEWPGTNPVPCEKSAWCDPLAWKEATGAIATPLRPGEIFAALAWGIACAELETGERVQLQAAGRDVLDDGVAP